MLSSEVRMLEVVLCRREFRLEFTFADQVAASGTAPMRMLGPVRPLSALRATRFATRTWLRCLRADSG